MANPWWEEQRKWNCNIRIQEKMLRCEVKWVSIGSSQLTSSCSHLKLNRSPKSYLIAGSEVPTPPQSHDHILGAQKEACIYNGLQHPMVTWPRFMALLPIGLITWVTCFTTIHYSHKLSSTCMSQLFLYIIWLYF